MGILVALTAALFWAISARFYGHSTKQWSVLLLNATKNGVAVVVLAVLLWLLPLQQTADAYTVWVLILSGIIGIGLGDTALLAALKRMGEQNTLLIAETLAPVVVVTLGFLLLAESLTWIQFFGILLVLFATDLAIGWRKQKQLDWWAVGFAVIAALCQATGALISRFFLTTTDLGVLESAVWRLLGGLAFALVGLIWMRYRRTTIRFEPFTRRQWVKLLVAIFLGTVIGVFMLQWSLALLPAGLAQTLIATSPLFAIVIAFFNKELVTKKQIVAVAIGLAGVALISLSGGGH
jgi:drug/metabolite transporter (DMT)-like permease